MTGQGGWPMTVFLTPGGAPYFGGHLLPPGAAGRAARLPRRPPRRRRRLPRPAATTSSGPAAEITLALAGAPRGRRGDEASARRRHEAVARLVEQTRPPPRRLRRRSQVPPSRAPSSCSCAAASRRWRRRGGRRAAATTLDRMLRGRHLRPARRRLPPLQRRRRRGPFPTSRRCSTTMPSWRVVYLHCAPADRRSRVPRARWRPPSTTWSARCASRGAASPPPRTPTPRGSRAGTSSGRPSSRPTAAGRRVSDAERSPAASSGCRSRGTSRRAAACSRCRLPGPARRGAGTRARRGRRAGGGLRRRLLASRARRVAPGRDDKVITAWNGLALRAFAEAGAALDRPDYVEIAHNCAGFLLGELVVEGRLRRSWKDGAVGVGAFLEDVACLGDGLLAVYEATGEPELLRAALGFAEEILRRFRDPDGGYFDTAADAEPLLVRPRGLEDNPLPAGQSMAAQLFVRLAGLTGEERWRDRPWRSSGPWRRRSAGLPWLSAASPASSTSCVAPSREVAIAGPRRRGGHPGAAPRGLAAPRPLPGAGLGAARPRCPCSPAGHRSPASPPPTSVRASSAGRRSPTSGGAGRPARRGGGSPGLTATRSAGSIGATSVRAAAGRLPGGVVSPHQV